MAKLKSLKTLWSALACLTAAAACSPVSSADRPQVLLPAEPAVRSGMKVLSLPAGYSASGSIGSGASLEITAMKTPKPGDGLYVQKTEYGYDASLVRGPGLYNITLQCPKQDKRCADETYIRKLVSDLKP